MPRYRRLVVPGSVQHIISRFVNRDFLLDLPHARASYLNYAAQAFERSDWKPLGYALMSSHVHWVFVAGDIPSDRLIRSMHSGFAGWLNRTAGRLGPVFADRHRNVECTGETAAGLLPYVHNNPGRAGLVDDPAESTWTSHRAYVGLEPAPEWLRVDLGLRICGFDQSVESRTAFHALVLGRRSEGRRAIWGADDLQAQRRLARRRLALPIEIGSPRVVGCVAALQRSVPIIIPETGPRRRYESAARVVSAIAATAGLDEALVSGRGRTRRITKARRLAVLVWCNELAGAVSEIAIALGISGQAASRYLRHGPPEDHAVAKQLAAALLEGDGPNLLNV